MDEAELRSWIDLSAKDLAAARYLLGLRPRPVEVICFLSQQSAEKILKAILVRDDTVVPRTHDLAALVQSMLSSYPQLNALLPRCIRLTVYAVSTRYPYPGELPPKAEETAIDDATEVMHFVKALLHR